MMNQQGLAALNSEQTILVQVQGCSKCNHLSLCFPLQIIPPNFPTVENISEIILIPKHGESHLSHIS